jgi:hypothetical protein
MVQYRGQENPPSVTYANIEACRSRIVSILSVIMCSDVSSIYNERYEIWKVEEFESCSGEFEFLGNK